MRVEKLSRKEAKRQKKKTDKKDRRKKSQENCRGSLTCANPGAKFMRANEMRKSQARQSLREIGVGTSREAISRGNRSVGNFRWIRSALKRFELSWNDTKARGNPDERRC